MNGEKRFIPGTNPKWGQELPDKRVNSLVNKFGDNRNDQYNFDDWDDDDDNVDEGELNDKKQQDDEEEFGRKAPLTGEQITFDDLAKQSEFDPEAAKRAREEEIERNKAS